jgi:hypothetical protein
MLIERTFGMLKGRFRTLTQESKHSIAPHVGLGDSLHMFT